MILKYSKGVNKVLKVEIPQNKSELEKQIKGLEYLIKNDTNEKDKRIHAQALKELQVEKMNSLENRLDEKLKYLYEMLKKYNELNDETKYKYLYRENGINEQIEALEQLRDNQTNDNWTECYEEDFREIKGSNK